MLSNRRTQYRFRIRELAALASGVAFATALTMWMVRREDVLTATLISAWAVGCILGIIVTSRFTSVVWGAIVGGGTLPVLLYFFYAAAGIARLSLLSLFFVWGFATIASALQAALMGIVGQGFTIGSPTKSQEAPTVRIRQNNALHASSGGQTTLHECSRPGTT